ncbi:hypothetical protein KAR91_46710 [Candidatus Pacearchaeota archaeon]|nr:hypothetical protein [Candidatus Pacearchaeota archaeon]
MSKCDKCEFKNKGYGENPCTVCSSNPTFEEKFKETKSEPVSAEYYIDTLCGDLQVQDRDVNLNHVKNAFKAGEANNEFRHRPQQTFKEWMKENSKIKDAYRIKAHLETWEASEKNRGYE